MWIDLTSSINHLLLRASSSLIDGGSCIQERRCLSSIALNQNLIVRCFNFWIDLNLSGFRKESILLLDVSKVKRYLNSKTSTLSTLCEYLACLRPIIIEYTLHAIANFHIDAFGFQALHQLIVYLDPGGLRKLNCKRVLLYLYDYIVAYPPITSS